MLALLIIFIWMILIGTWVWMTVQHFAPQTKLKEFSTTNTRVPKRIGWKSSKDFSRLGNLIKRRFPFIYQAHQSDYGLKTIPS
uniref:SFRICE_036211 n=1 Tax=Spodoptera frugiperda TaxID=7108 RepID=A0A2H1WUH7_SPOFR